MNLGSNLIQLEKEFVERPWGGGRLAEQFGSATDRDARIGEVWLVSDLGSRATRIAGGPYAGEVLSTVLQREAPALLGSHAKPAHDNRFPLMLKLLDVHEWLSVQVHPSSAETIKSELWHVLDARGAAEVLVGFADADQDAAGLPTGADWPRALSRHRPRVTDSYYVPAGTVHAIGPGLLLAELQQTSDTTYRFYDWDRKPGRPLQVDEGRAAIRYDDTRAGRVAPLSISETRTLICATEAFAAERVAVRGELMMRTEGRSFHIVLAIDGTLRAATESGSVLLTTGDAVVVPAAAQRYTLSGEGAGLVAYVPDITLDIIEPLRAAGHGDAAIAAIHG